jgi:hypothetical protein
MLTGPLSLKDMRVSPGPKTMVEAMTLNGSLFSLRRTFYTEEIKWFLTKGIIEQHDCKENICDKSDNNEYLNLGRLLNILS